MRVQKVVLLAFVAVLTACVSPRGPEQGATCCGDIERYPTGLVDAFRPIAPEAGRVLAHVNWRKGYLLKREDAHAAIRAELRPLDVLITSSKGRITGHTIPGLFTHALIYLGTEAELKRAGVWETAAVRPFHQQVRAGKVFIESEHDGVHLSAEHVVLNTDRVAVLRPRAATAARKAKALQDYFTAIGMPFDFRFDVTTPDRAFCAELVAIVMPELGLPVTEAYGIKMILPESLPASAVDGTSGLGFVSYTRAGRDGWERLGASGLKADIEAEWAKHKRSKHR